MSIGNFFGRKRINNNSVYQDVSVVENSNNDDDSFNRKNHNDNYKYSCINSNNERRSSSDSIDNMCYVDFWRVSSLVSFFA